VIFRKENGFLSQFPDVSAMKIGILGSGPVGRSLGKGFASNGHDVRLGSRTPEKQELQDWLKECI
jgi:predicted dinucleotide-binding enzyme